MKPFFPCAMTLLLVACAGTASRNTQAPAPTHEPAEASAQSAADRRFTEGARGYKIVVRDGKKFYCRSEKASGSKITAVSCLTENELRTQIEETETYKRRPKPSLCAPDDPRCGGG